MADNQKEPTPAEILPRVKDEVAKEYGFKDYSDLEDNGSGIFAEDFDKSMLRFHSAMIEALAPSDEDIKQQGEETWEQANSFYERGVNPSAFMMGWNSAVKAMRDHFKKGEQSS